ncbi:MAG: COX15/CtaA family protein, partial [Planctomycetaceae bacterium]|nr:COX15/CtaA family protein [Planctomycetaceae bacterium]
MTSRTVSKASSSDLAYRPSPHWMAVFATLFTFPLLFVGGSVTTYRVGLAVPDWPTTFGINMFLYDFWNAPFGVRIEHTHRLYGAAVGLATIGLCSWFLVFEPRRWMKWLGALALLAVIAQGVLGGTRVTQVSTLLAAVHGCTAMTYFGLMVALCVLTGRAWFRNQPEVHDQHRL